MGRELKRIIVVLVASLVIAHTSFAAAEECKRKNEKQSEGQIGRFIDGLSITFKTALGRKHESREYSANKIEGIIEELGLTLEQSEQIRERRSQYRQSLKQSRNLLRQKQEELRAELEREKSDMKKLGRIAVDIKELQSGIIDQRVESVLGMKEILTPEQYRMFRQRSNELRQKAREGKVGRRPADDSDGRPKEKKIIEKDIRRKDRDRYRSLYYSLDDLEEFRSLKDAGIISAFEFNDMKEKVLKNEGQPRKNIDLDSSIFDRLRKLRELEENGAIGSIDCYDKKKQLLAGFPGQEQSGGRHQGRCSIFEALRELHALRQEGIIESFDFGQEKEQLLRWY